MWILWSYIFLKPMCLPAHIFLYLKACFGAREAMDRMKHLSSKPLDGSGNTWPWVLSLTLLTASCLHLIFPSLIMAVNCGWFTVTFCGHCSFRLLYWEVSNPSLNRCCCLLLRVGCVFSLLTVLSKVHFAVDVHINGGRCKLTPVEMFLYQNKQQLSCL